MNCPNGDGHLHKHTRTDHSGYSIRYSVCDTCRSYWLDHFSANALKKSDITKKRTTNRPRHHTAIPTCPQCKDHLIHARGENIPPGIAVWKCPHNHGYFFDEAELVRFKEAQDIKLRYHQIWHIPLGSPTSIILSSLVLAILSFSAVTTYFATKQSQTTRSFATSHIHKQQAIVNTADKTVSILTTTKIPTVVILNLDKLYPTGIKMDTTDGIGHFAQLSHIPPGTYEYYFSLQLEDGTVDSDSYTFIMP